MIFKLEEEQYELIKKYVKPCCEDEVVRQYIQNEIIFNDATKTVTVDVIDVEEFMSAADDAIICYGMVNQDYLSPLGCKLQLLYDELLYQKNKNEVKQG